MIDLRSDTVTKPTSAMLEEMMLAEVGDDVFGEDPTVRRLEDKCAAMFGMERGLYCPSGTMANQIGIKLLTNPYEEVICYEGAHIYKYEGGGVAGNSGLSMRLLKGDRGRLSLEDILANINPDDIHAPKTTLLALENTVNKGGGSYYTLDQLKKIALGVRGKGVHMHLDGARLFNALVETGDDPSAYGQYFDTVSVCLSKGLGAPIGSVLLASEELYHRAKRVRKYMGGGMRQAGYLAKAGIYALDHHFERLKEDHQRAREIGEVLQRQAYVEKMLPVDTNIVIFTLSSNIEVATALEKMKENNILAVPFGQREIRFVTHIDFDDQMLDQLCEVLKRIQF